MTKEAIRTAIMEARRFIEKAEAVEFYVRCADSMATYKHPEVATEGKRAAAMKRASLDLSQALATMRRTPRW